MNLLIFFSIFISFDFYCFKLRHPDLQQGASKSGGKPKLTSPFAFYWTERSKQLARSGKFVFGFVSGLDLILSLIHFQI